MKALFIYLNRNTYLVKSQNMNILAVYVYGYKTPTTNADKPLLNFRCVPSGFAAVLTEIRKNGHNVELAVYSPYIDINKLTEKKLAGKKYDFVCITAVSTHLKIVKKIAEKIKSIQKNAVIMAGGPHATLNPSDFLKDPNFDAVCVGEGFVTIKSFLKYLEKDKRADQLKGFIIKENGKIIENKAAPFSDFKKFPVIDRSLWDKYIADKTSHSILLSRGCVYQCSFCSNHIMAAKNKGLYCATRSVKNIIDELKKINKTYKNVSLVLLESETITIDLKFTYKLLNAIIKYNSRLRSKIRFTANISFNAAVYKDADRFLKKLKEANFVEVGIGLESGSQRIRKEVLKRPSYSNNEFIEFCKKIKNADIFVSLYVMIGLPYETEADIDKTVKAVEKINPYSVRPSVFYPYPGTEIYKIMVDKKMIDANAVFTGWDERIKPVIKYRNLNKQTIIKNFNYLQSKYGINRKYNRVKAVSNMLKSTR